MTDLAIQPPVSAESFVDEWERKPGESARAFRAFTIFRDMGDERGVTKVRDVGGGASLKTLMEWAEKWRWVDRANAYDRMLDRRRVKAQIEEIEAQARRQVIIGQTLQETGLSWVKEETATPEQRAKNLTAASALRYIDKGIELERQGLGVDEKDSAGDTNITVNVLEAGTKLDVFGKIGEMHLNMRRIQEAGPASLLSPPDIVDAEVVEDEEG